MLKCKSKNLKNMITNIFIQFNVDVVERASKRSSLYNLLLRSTDPLLPTLGGRLDAIYSNSTSGLVSHLWKTKQMWKLGNDGFSSCSALREGFKNPSNGNFPLTFSPAVVR